jgi:hypothetical protein
VIYDGDRKAALLSQRSTCASNYKREMSVRYIKNPYSAADQWHGEEPAATHPETDLSEWQRQTAAKQRKASDHVRIHDDGYLPTNVVISTAAGSEGPADDGYLEYCGGETQSNNNASVTSTKTTARKFITDYEDNEGDLLGGLPSKFFIKEIV